MSNVRQDYEGNVAIGLIGGAPVHLSVFGSDQVATIQKVIDVYLNTRPEAPKWLFDLSDALNPVKVPERRSIPHG